MQGYPFGPRVRTALVLALAAGWLAGLGVQVLTRAWTGYMDIFPPQMILGALLCFGAGFAARALDRVRRSARRGAIAGVAMLGSILGGYAAMVAIWWNPTWNDDGGGETWFSMLIELPFWVGMPIVVGSICGAAGWMIADRLARES
jgi:hypothetical protein